MRQMQSQISDDSAAPEAQGGATPAQDSLLQFFEFSHLPPHLAEISSGFFELAHHISATLPRNPERTVALRKLLEAKDCAVRAKLFK